LVNSKVFVAPPLWSLGCGFPIWVGGGVFSPPKPTRGGGPPHFSVWLAGFFPGVYFRLAFYPPLDIFASFFWGGFFFLRPPPPPGVARGTQQKNPNFVLSFVTFSSKTRVNSGLISKNCHRFPHLFGIGGSSMIFFSTNRCFFFY